MVRKVIEIGGLPIAPEAGNTIGRTAVTSSSSSGGGGDDDVSWVTTMWVCADADQAAADGTPGNPFASIQQAHDALPPGDGGTIMVAKPLSGGYNENLVFDRPVTMLGFAIGGVGVLLSADGVAVGNVTTNSTLRAENFDAQTWTTTIGVVVTCKGCSGVWHCTGALFLENCSTGDSTTATDLRAYSCTFANDITIDGVAAQLIDCNFIGSTSVVTFDPLGGLLTLDSYSQQQFLTANGSIVNGIRSVQEQPFAYYFGANTGAIAADQFLGRWSLGNVVTEVTNKIPILKKCTLGNLRIKSENGNITVADFIVTVRKNGVDTAITTRIVAGTAVAVPDLTHQVGYDPATDDLSMKVTGNGTTLPGPVWATIEAM